ncbi:unnamed protein product, partial [Rotaria magnacalcarata]
YKTPTPNDRLEQLNRLRTDVEELACVQDATQQNTNSIKTSIDWIEQDINKIRFNFRSLLIDEHLIVRRSQDLLSFPPSNQVIELTDSSYAGLAGNKQHLLVHREPTLCLLDRQSTTNNETPWSLDDISDICWSSVLNRFDVCHSLLSNGLSSVDRSCF